LEQIALAAVFAEPPVTLVWHGWVARKIREDLSGFFCFWRPMIGAGMGLSAGSVRYGRKSLFCATRFGANAVG
jgi:hypothetical protein